MDTAAQQRIFLICRILPGLLRRTTEFSKVNFMSFNFIVTNTGDFPYSGNNVGIGLTVARVSGDPMVLYLNQTSYSDPISYLSLALDHEYKQPQTPPGMDTISGLAFDPNREIVYTSSGTTDEELIGAFDPITDQQVGEVRVGISQELKGYGSPAAMGTNGAFLIRAGRETVEMRGMFGALLSQKQYPGRHITGASGAYFGWVLADRNAHQILVLDPFGNITAEVPAPGPAGGLGAVAFDYVVNHNRMPQVIPPSDGSAPGKPDERWDPEPWLMRHRIYVANSNDETIYAGYIHLS